MNAKFVPPIIFTRKKLREPGRVRRSIKNVQSFNAAAKRKHALPVHDTGTTGAAGGGAVMSIPISSAHFNRC